MRTDQVPQDGNSTFEGQRKAMYALDENGAYTLVASAGWEAEEMVTTEAVAWFEQQAQAALQRARKGDSSPLEYHMYAQRMDVPTLAQATGLWQWRIRRHLRADVFSKLAESRLQQYAEALGIRVATLRTLP